MIAWFSLLLAICFAPVLYGMGKEWLDEEDMGHGFFVPVVAGWILWQDRRRLLAVEAQPNLWGLAPLLFGGALLVFGTLGAELFVSRVGFLFSLVGTIVTLGGWNLLRAAAYPLFLLVFMIRIPAILYNQITFPLQIFASSVAEHSLWALGIPALREGNVLELPSQRLQVVEACSGIRSLLSLSFLSLVYAYFFDTKIWMRGALLAATVPIAIGANAFRVTMTGVLSEYKKELAEGFFHAAEGWVVFLIALTFLVIVHRIIDRAWGLCVRRANPAAGAA
jgi:exosortase